MNEMNEKNNKTSSLFKRGDLITFGTFPTINVTKELNKEDVFNHISKNPEKDWNVVPNFKGAYFIDFSMNGQKYRALYFKDYFASTVSSVFESDNKDYEEEFPDFDEDEDYFDEDDDYFDEDDDYFDEDEDYDFDYDYDDDPDDDYDEGEVTRFRNNIKVDSSLAASSAQKNSKELNFQLEAGYKNKTFYFFQFSPINWRVLSVDEEKYALLSEEVIDRYASEYGEMDIVDDDYDNVVGFPFLREYLDTYFSNVAFTDEERNALKGTLVLNTIDEKKDSWSKNIFTRKAFANWEDCQISIPSFSDLNFHDGTHDEKMFSKGVPTDYALALGSGRKGLPAPQFVRAMNIDGEVCEITTDFMKKDGRYFPKEATISGVRPVIYVKKSELERLSASMLKQKEDKDNPLIDKATAKAFKNTISLSKNTELFFLVDYVIEGNGFDRVFSKLKNGEIDLKPMDKFMFELNYDRNDLQTFKSCMEIPDFPPITILQAATIYLGVLGEQEDKVKAKELLSSLPSDCGFDKDALFYHFIILINQNESLVTDKQKVFANYKEVKEYIQTRENDPSFGDELPFTLYLKSKHNKSKKILSEITIYACEVRKKKFATKNKEDTKYYEACIKEGLVYFDLGKNYYPQMLKEFEEAGVYGYYHIGNCYLNGYGVSKNIATAEEYFNKGYLKDFGGCAWGKLKILQKPYNYQAPGKEEYRLFKESKDFLICYSFPGDWKIWEKLHEVGGSRFEEFRR